MREELATTERRAEEEHSAHNATKMVCCLNDAETVYNRNMISPLFLHGLLFLRQAAMERERELEHRAIDASTALVRIQVRQGSSIDRY